MSRICPLPGGIEKDNKQVIEIIANLKATKEIIKSALAVLNLYELCLHWAFRRNWTSVKRGMPQLYY